MNKGTEISGKVIEHCPACGNSPLSTYQDVKQMPMALCHSCGLILRNPLPDKEELKKIYQENYYDSWGGEAAEVLVKKQKQMYFKAHLKRLGSVLASESRILDLGCAKGYFAKLATDLGYDAHGLEISQYAAARAAELIGEDHVHCGTLEDASYETETFDAITMFDFIEHLEEPAGAIKKAISLIKPGGYLYIVTPDTDSISFKLMGGQWWHYKEEHLYYYSHKSLAGLLESAGAEVMEYGHCKKSLTIEYLLKQLIAYPVKGTYSIVRALGALAPGFIKRRIIRLPSGELYMLARTDQNAKG